MKILFVDDTRETRDMFEMAFHMQGHETRHAVNGLQAVEAVRAGAFDVIVIDAEMPIMNGWDAVREIRTLSNGAKVPVVLLSAYSQSEDQQRATEVGIDLLLGKPILPQELLAQIANLVALCAAFDPETARE